MAVLALGALFVLVTIMAFLFRTPGRLGTAAAGLGSVGAAATIATAAGFAFDTNASEGRWVESANEAVFALVGLAVVARGSRDARALAGGALGLLSLAVGLSKIPVLLHGVVLSALPALAARIAVVVTIAAAAAATAVGLAVFFDLSDREEEEAAWR